MNINNVGNYCKQFRIDILNMTLTDFATNTKANIKNISSFESGRANNIRYLYLYYQECKTQFTKKMFTDGLFETMDV